MKKRMVLTFLLFVVLAPPAFAGENWVEQFLSRYRAEPLSFQVNPAAQDPLPGLIRSGVLPLSIGDLINLTLENNLDIAVTRLSPITSQYLIETSYRPFEPTLKFGASVSRDTSASRNQLSGAESLSQLTHNYTVGFAQTLSTGTDLAVDFTMNRSSSNNAFNTFNPAWVGLMRYSVTQHLLRDFGRAVNKRQIRIAQNNKTISEVQFERQVIDLVVEAQKAYWDLVFTAEDQKVKQRSLDLAEKTLSDNRVQVDIGTLAPIDLLQAQRQVAVNREELIVSTFTQSQIQDQIKKLFSSQPDPGLVLARLSPTQGAGKPIASDVLPVDQAIKLAMENRPELREIGLELQNNEIEIEYTKNQLRPSVNLSATYTQNGVGGTETLREGFGPDARIIQVIPGGPSDAFRQVFGYNFTGYSVGLDVQIPLRNRAQRADYSRALTEKRTSEQRVKATESQIALEVRNAITQVEMNKARIETAQRSRELAEQQLTAEQRKFELGASTVRFVLEEQRNVSQMQTNEIGALINYTKALVDYERAVGMTLKRNNVEIDKALSASR